MANPHWLRVSTLSVGCVISRALEKGEWSQLLRREGISSHILIFKVSQHKISIQICSCEASLHTEYPICYDVFLFLFCLFKIHKVYIQMAACINNTAADGHVYIERRHRTAASLIVFNATGLQDVISHESHVRFINHLQKWSTELQCACCLNCLDNEKWVGLKSGP